MHKMISEIQIINMFYSSWSKLKYFIVSVKKIVKQRKNKYKNQTWSNKVTFSLKYTLKAFHMAQYEVFLYLDYLIDFVKSNMLF
jgi:hypothetical protein